MVRIKGKSYFGTFKKTRPILDFCKIKVQSVSYKVSLRWLYYHCVQVGLVRKSYNGLSCFSQLISEARKRFYDIWTPDTLSDSLREPYFVGHSSHNFNIMLDVIEERENYVQCWFEAEAMNEQFLYFTKPYRISLVAFRGDPSLSLKWKLAKYLEAIHKDFPDKKIKILYFGDFDKKGLQIINSALKDIRKWCSVKFDFEHVGLTLEQAKSFNLPENPNKPNSFQWESLSNEQAGKLIISSVAKYIGELNPEIEEKEKELEETLDEYYKTL